MQREIRPEPGKNPLQWDWEDLEFGYLGTLHDKDNLNQYLCGTCPAKYLAD